jgi:uncharacterized membrane protein
MQGELSRPIVKVGAGGHLHLAYQMTARFIYARSGLIWMRNCVTGILYLAAKAEIRESAGVGLLLEVWQDFTRQQLNGGEVGDIVGTEHKIINP